MIGTNDGLERVRALATRHEVVFHVYPVRHAASGGVEVVGFEIELLGVHREPKHVPEPGCDECAIVYQDLREIARHVLPPSEPETEVELHALEPRHVYDRRHHGEPAVALTLQVLHRRDYGSPVDRCEERCKDRIVAALRRLGIPSV